MNDGNPYGDIISFCSSFTDTLSSLCGNCGCICQPRYGCARIISSCVVLCEVRGDLLGSFGHFGSHLAYSVGNESTRYCQGRTLCSRSDNIEVGSPPDFWTVGGLVELQVLGLHKYLGIHKNKPPGLQQGDLYLSSLQPLSRLPPSSSSTQLCLTGLVPTSTASRATSIRRST